MRQLLIPNTEEASLLPARRSASRLFHFFPLFLLLLLFRCISRADTRCQIPNTQWRYHKINQQRLQAKRLKPVYVAQLTPLAIIGQTVVGECDWNVDEAWKPYALGT